MSSAAPNPESLMAELRFAQAIARHLVSDHHVADEVAQEAILAALQRPDVDDTGKRAWLAGVIRNLVNNRSRERRRRQEREVRYAQDNSDRFVGEPQNAAQEALMRGEQKARIASLVMALAEPYRTVIVLRYMEEMSPPQVARELDRPVETVKTQLRRGMARLREELDARSGGDGTAWALALLPLVAPRYPLPMAPPTPDGGVEAPGVHPEPALTTVSSTGALFVVPLWALGSVAALLVVAAAVLGPRWIDGRGVESNQGAVPMVRLVPAAPIAARSAAESDTVLGGADAPGELSRQPAALEPALPVAADGESIESEAAGIPQVLLRIREAGSGRAVSGVKIEYYLWAAPATDLEGPLEEESLGAQLEDSASEPFEVGAGKRLGAEPPTEDGEPSGGPAMDDAGSAPFVFVTSADDWVIDSLAETALAADAAGGDEEERWMNEGMRQAETDASGEARLADPDLQLGSGMAFLAVNASLEGYASVEHTCLVDLAQPKIDLVLQRPGHLLLQRGDLDPRATVVVAVSDMILSTRKADLMKAGDESLSISDLAAGVYRLSARAFLPEFGREPVFELEEILVRTDASHSSEFVLWKGTERDLNLQLEGAPAEAESLRIRARGRYESGRFALMTSVVDGLARLPGLGTQALGLEVLDGADVLATDRLAAASETSEGSSAAGRAREHTLVLASGSLAVSLAGEAGPAVAESAAESAAGAAAEAKTGTAAEETAEPQRVRFALRAAASSASPPFTRTGSWTLTELQAGARVPSLMPGSYELWWVLGERAGHGAVEIGAGESTLVIDLRAPGAVSVTLRACQCAETLTSLEIRAESGATLPLELLGEDWPLEWQLFLPAGHYVASYRTVEFSKMEHPFELSGAAATEVLHGPEIGTPVELVFPNGSSGLEVLVARADGPSSSGHLVELNENRVALVYLTPGTYRVSDRNGRAATFAASADQTRISLRLDR